MNSTKMCEMIVKGILVAWAWLKHKLVLRVQRWNFVKGKHEALRSMHMQHADVGIDAITIYFMKDCLKLGIEDGNASL